ncbi:PilZ domain-containing protein [Novosphingobium sp. RL4]|nr:PilZ domain-containing protein [Novosphingobium sp. RL4]MPS69049.1 hypothetical protein [Novosphingobium sp.]WRT92186.1 PilZ domain-containing protein [Novosphingobium sp. RL4]
MVQVRVCSERGEGEAFVLDASSHGMRLTMSKPPERGERVRMVVGGQSISGEVRWRLGNRCGVALREPISVIALIEGGDIPITLSAAAAARDKRQGLAGILASDGPLLGRVLQFALIAAVLGCGALMVSHFVTASIGSLEAARETVAGAGDL